MSDSISAAREGERARLGRHVPEHVYLDGEPLCTLPAATDAEVVRLLNAGTTLATDGARAGVPDDLRRLSEAATPGPWTVESERFDGLYGSGEDTSEGYDVAVIVTEAEMAHGKPGVLFESHNSTIGSVREESDDEYFSAWDETSKANAEFIVALVNAYRSGALADPRPQAGGAPGGTDLRTGLGKPFLTMHAGGRDGYFVRLKYRTAAETQAAHEALFQFFEAGNGEPANSYAEVEAGVMAMLTADCARMRAAGTKLSEAALRVIREYDGTHRLSLAVAEWAKAIADESGRGERACPCHPGDEPEEDPEVEEHILYPGIGAPDEASYLTGPELHALLGLEPDEELEVDEFGGIRTHDGQWRRKGDGWRFHREEELGLVVIGEPKAALTRPAADPGAQARSTWTCAGRKANGANDPGECDWPVCGCDPHADKVIGALQESGLLPATPAPAATGDAGADRVRIAELEAALASDARVEAILQAVLTPAGDPEHGIRDHLPRVLRDFLNEETGRAGLTGFDDGYAEGYAKAKVDFAAQATPPAPSADPVPAGQGDGASALERVRHVRTGGEYEVIGEAEITIAPGYGDGCAEEARTRFIRDESTAVVYRSVETGKLWCRLADEFRDGRFETIAPPAPSNAGGAV